MTAEGPYEALKYRIQQIQEIKIGLEAVLNDFLQSRYGQTYHWQNSPGINSDIRQTIVSLTSIRSRELKKDSRAIFSATISADGKLELSVEEGHLDEDGWQNTISEATVGFGPNDDPDFIVADALVELGRLGEYEIGPQIVSFIEEKTLGTRPAMGGPFIGPELGGID